jgi:hypothetical protein
MCLLPPCSRDALSLLHISPGAVLSRCYFTSNSRIKALSAKHRLSSFRFRSGIPLVPSHLGTARTLRVPRPTHDNPSIRAADEQGRRSPPPAHSSISTRTPSDQRGQVTSTCSPHPLDRAPRTDKKIILESSQPQPAPYCRSGSYLAVRAAGFHVRGSKS